MFDACAAGDVAHIDAIFKFCHTRVNMLMRVWQELEYRIDVCRVTHGAHFKHLQLSKNFFSFPVAVNSSINVGTLVFLL